jgi:hypothetical protein
MIDAPQYETRTATEWARLAQGRDRKFLLAAILVSVAAGGAYVAMGLDNILFPLILLLCIGGPILLWLFPRLGLYIALIGTCLFEIFPTGYGDALTDQVPFFWNVNTIFQKNTGADFHGIPLNLFEVILAIVGGMSLFRNVYLRTVSVRGGVLFLPILFYICCVGVGWINGMATGGDFKLSLQEVRAQFYFFIAYLMAFNMVRDSRQVDRLWWITALCIGLKGILYTFRRYVTIGGQPLPDQGVGSHEEAFFFDIYVVQLLILTICGLHPKMRILLWLLLPTVILGNLATNRRSGTAAMIIAVPYLLAAAFYALPKRRVVVSVIVALLAIIGPPYYAIFKNSDSAIAQPARAIRSQFQPDQRDLDSDQYRIAENACQMATITQNGVTLLIGYGYGKRMLHAVPIADISADYEWWDLLPHNQVLWVWMRTGTLGFFAFWMMISSIVVYCCRILRSQTADISVKAASMTAMTTIGMLMIFGLLDLQLSCFRDMIFAGMWVGVAAARSERHLS